MKMNKTYVLNEIKTRLNYTEEQAVIVNNILEDTFLIGKSNKDKVITRYMNELNVDEEEANKIYETTSTIFAEGIKERLKHPFKSIDD